MKAWSYKPFRAINALYKERRSRHGAGAKDFDRRLANAIGKLGKAYNVGKQAEFKNSFDRLAYVVQYAPIGIAAVRRLINHLAGRSLPPQLSILHDEPLAVVSIGAGPGTDLFGILMGFATPPVGLRFTCIDVHRKWKTYYKRFVQDFTTQVAEMKQVLDDMESIFVTVDLEKQSLENGKCGRELSQADIVVLNRVLSTFHSNSHLPSRLIRRIARVSPNNTLLVMVDVSLPRPEFRQALARAERTCRLEKPNSKWVAKCLEMNESNFGWQIPRSIMRLERYGRHITRSGRFFGGVIWLKK